MTSSLLSTDRLTCVRNHRKIFENISLAVAAGEVLQITGVNGSGKTNLLRILAGLQQPYSGKVYWNGQEVTDREQYHHVAYVGHKIAIKSSLTVYENLRWTHHHRKHVSEHIDQALMRLGMIPYRQVVCGHLSAGQRQRVALARLLLSEAKVWFLDEPLTHMDQSGNIILQDLITQHTQQGGSVVFTSHQQVSLHEVTVAKLSLSL